MDRTRIRFRARFFTLLALVLLFAGTGGFFLLRNRSEGELTDGAMRLTLRLDTVIVRDEICISTERYDRILFDVIEGADVQADEQIAQVFKWGYQEETMQTLLEVQKQILEHQSKLIEGIVNQELDALTLQLEQKQQEIRAARNAQNGQDILQLEQELKTLLLKRAELLRDIQPDEALNDLYLQQEQQLKNLSTWKRDIINTVGEGVVSFYFDGYEQALNANKLNMINADLIGGVLRGTSITQGGSSSAESLLYRLVDSSHFYVAFLTDAASPLRVVENETYTLVFDGYASRPFSGTALAPIVSDKKIVNILEFHQDMGSLLGVRVVSASLMKDAAGLKIPVKAIEMREGRPGILRVSGDETIFTQVDVLAADETEAIIRASNTEQLLVAGLRYKKP